VLTATGSEVHLALNAPDRLAGEGVNARSVSLPSWSLFKVQPELYGNQILPAGVPLLAIEAGATLGWNAYVGPPEAVIGVDRFGASAPGEVVMREYGFTVGNVCLQALALLPRTRDRKVG
jgi:transketolase